MNALTAVLTNRRTMTALTMMPMTLRDMDLAGNLVSAGMNQLQIPDKSSGERILDGDDHGIDIGRIIGREHLLETVETLQFQRNVLIKSHGSLLVETAPTPQYRDFFHSSVQKKGHPHPDGPTYIFMLIGYTTSGYYLS